MTQTVILEKFTKYLDVISSEYIDDLNKQIISLKDKQAITHIENIKNKHQTYIENLKKEFERGHCFGLSLCHAAMDLSGKLNWWEHVLVTIANWDGQKSSLDIQLILPDSINNKPTTLREMFERAMNYIISSHSSSTFNDFKVEGTTQLNILNPDARIIPAFNKQSETKQSYFEMIDENEEIRTIKQRKVVAGNFTESQLDSLLSKETIQDRICLIHSTNHAIRVGYRDGKWIIYDPDSSHSQLSTIHFSGSKQEVIQEIFSSLETHSVAIQVAAFDENKTIDFSAYDRFLKTSPNTLLKETGLHMIAKRSPKCLTELFKLADDTPEGKAIRSAIAEALVKQTTTGNWTALHIIARYAPKSLPALFKLADDTPEGKAIRSAIAKAIVKKTTNNLSALNLIAAHAPQQLRSTINFVDNTGDNVFHSALKMKDIDVLQYLFNLPLDNTAFTQLIFKNNANDIASIADDLYDLNLLKQLKIERLDLQQILKIKDGIFTLLDNIYEADRKKLIDLLTGEQINESIKLVKHLNKFLSLLEDQKLSFLQRYLADKKSFIALMSNEGSYLEAISSLNEKEKAFLLTTIGEDLPKIINNMEKFESGIGFLASGNNDLHRQFIQLLGKSGLQPLLNKSGLGDLPMVLQPLSLENKELFLQTIGGGTLLTLAQKNPRELNYVLNTTDTKTQTAILNTLGDERLRSLYKDKENDIKKDLVLSLLDNKQELKKIINLIDFDLVQLKDNVHQLVNTMKISRSQGNTLNELIKEKEQSQLSIR